MAPSSWLDKITETGATRQQPAGGDVSQRTADAVGSVALAPPRLPMEASDAARPPPKERPCGYLALHDEG